MREKRGQTRALERNLLARFFTLVVSIVDAAEKLAIPVNVGVGGGGGDVRGSGVAEWRQKTMPFRRRPKHNSVWDDGYVFVGHRQCSANPHLTWFYLLIITLKFRLLPILCSKY